MAEECGYAAVRKFSHTLKCFQKVSIITFLRQLIFFFFLCQRLITGLLFFYGFIFCRISERLRHLQCYDVFVQLSNE